MSPINIAPDADEPDSTHLTRGTRPRIRAPQAGDAAAICELVRATPALDANSAYTYLLLCTDFAATSAVAEEDGRVVGFVVGYRPPGRPEALFVWQVAVGKDQRGRGLGARLLSEVLERSLEGGVAYLEATVTPSNEASWSLFRGFARRAGADCREAPGFSSQLFPDGDHEDEMRIRIGPLDTESLRLHNAAERTPL